MSGALPGAVGQRLRQIAGWAIAGTLGASVGCGPVETNIIELPRSARAAAGGVAPAIKEHVLGCGEQPMSNFPFLLAGPVDYLAVYSTLNIAVNSYGVACRDAPDPADCAMALQRAIAVSQACKSLPSDCDGFVVTTRAGQVERYDSIASLTSVFGEIDTEAEAAVVAGLVNTFGYCWAIRVYRTDSGYRVETQRDQYCGRLVREAVEVHRDGSTSGVILLSDPAAIMCPAPVPGRRTAGLELTTHADELPALGSFFAHMAQLEAASVPSFVRLGRELARLGAPDALRSACERSAREERTHAQLMAALATRHGARVLLPRLHAPRAQRSAFEIALENAREGCVRESFAALLALHQAAAAHDPTVRQVMRSIAADEVQHAELAHQIAAWLTPQLHAHEQHLIARARAETFHALARDIDQDCLPDDTRRLVGWPSRSAQHSLLNASVPTLERAQAASLK